MRRNSGPGWTCVGLAARPGGNVELHRANKSTALWPDNPGACGGLTFGGGPE